MSLSYPRLRRRRRGWWKGEEPTPGNVFFPRIRFLHVSFDDPPRSLANLQQWIVKVRKSKAGANPTFSADLYYSGTKIGTLIPETSIFSTTGTILEVEWSASTLPSISGTGVEGRIISTSHALGVEVDIAAFKWQPTLS